MTGKRVTRWSQVVLPLQHCQRLSRCRFCSGSAHLRRVLSGGRHFTLLPRNRGYTSAPERSSHWQTSLKVTGGIILSALGVYYVSQWVIYMRIHMYLTEPSLEKMSETGRWRFMNTSPRFEFEVWSHFLPGRCLLYHAIHPVRRTIKKRISCWI